ncbi:MAG TPA: hypothetical protein VE032_08400 [Actinomycetota bacterium]|nr:hypothetical protein [Actinomycetota bacterium]
MDVRTADGAIAEIRKVKETADRLANGNYPEGADHERVLAGMIAMLAEQVERLAVPQHADAPLADVADA